MPHVGQGELASKSLKNSPVCLIVLTPLVHICLQFRHPSRACVHSVSEDPTGYFRLSSAGPLYSYFTRALLISGAGN